MRGRRLLLHVQSSLWFIPVVCVLAGAILSFGTIAIDKLNDFELVPEWLTGGPDAAVAILSTVAASMVSLAALVLTITMVVVQLAMGQFSPRIVQTILRDKPSQIAIGLFVATFVHAMLALREVRFEDGGSVPGLAIIVAYILVVISVVVLVLYVHHIGRSLRVSALIELVGNQTHALLDRIYPDHLPGAEVAGNVIPAPASGVVNAIGHEELVELARAANCKLELVPALGAFVPAGAPLFRVVDGDARQIDHDEAARAMLLGLERTLDEDVAYGLRMLVDMAERAVSDSAFLDPTTAVQAIDRLHDCLRQLACRKFPGGDHKDADGIVRLVVPAMDWDAFVNLAFDEIRLAGAKSPQVTRRLSEALTDLETIAPPERLPVLRKQRALLLASVGEAVVEEDDITFALQPDRQGIGVAANAPL